MLIIFVMNIMFQLIFGWFAYMTYAFRKIWKIMDETDTDIEAAAGLFKQNMMNSVYNFKDED